jgi:cytochrome c oxidase subunit I+III
VVVLICVAASIFGSLIFSYFFLWTVNGAPWPPPAVAVLPDPAMPVVAALLLVTSAGIVRAAHRALARDHHGGHAVLLLCVAALFLLGGLGVEAWGQRAVGAVPTEHSYSATIWTMLGLNGVLAVTLTLMTGLCFARWFAGILRPERRATFDCTTLLWQYAVVQGLVGLAVVHLGPRLL